MTDLPNYVAHYLAQLGGPQDDAAFHSLLEAGSGALPILMSAFSVECRPGLRATLVKIIWQYRNPMAIDFLAGALNDPDPAIWKEALDGLVAIGGPQALAVLRATREQARERAGPVPLAWFDEALDQVRANTEKGENGKSQKKTASP